MNKRRFISRNLLLMFFLTILTSNILHAKNLFYYSDAHLSFNIPIGWGKLPNNIVDEYYKELEKEIQTTAKRPALAFNRTKATSPFEYPYFLIHIYKQNINDSIIEEYISSTQKATEKMIKKFQDKIYINDALIKKPLYDQKRKVLIYSIDSTHTIEGKEISINSIIAFFFYKNGIVAFNFYSTKESIDEYISDFEEVINSVVFDNGYEYSSTLFGDNLLKNVAKGIVMAIILALLGKFIWRKKKYGGVT